MPTTTLITIAESATTTRVTAGSSRTQVQRAPPRGRGGAALFGRLASRSTAREALATSGREPMSSDIGDQQAPRGKRQRRAAWSRCPRTSATSKHREGSASDERYGADVL